MKTKVYDLRRGDVLTNGWTVIRWRAADCTTIIVEVAKDGINSEFVCPVWHDCLVRGN